jgi:hypothetical protein
VSITPSTRVAPNGTAVSFRIVARNHGKHYAPEMDIEAIDEFRGRQRVGGTCPAHVSADGDFCEVDAKPGQERVETVRDRLDGVDEALLVACVRNQGAVPDSKPANDCATVRIYITH